MKFNTVTDALTYLKEQSNVIDTKFEELVTYQKNSEYYKDYILSAKEEVEENNKLYGTDDVFDESTLTSILSYYITTEKNGRMIPEGFGEPITLRTDGKRNWYMALDFSTRLHNNEGKNISEVGVVLNKNAFEVHVMYTNGDTYRHYPITTVVDINKQGLSSFSSVIGGEQ